MTPPTDLSSDHPRCASRTKRKRIPVFPMILNTIFTVDVVYMSCYLPIFYTSVWTCHLPFICFSWLSRSCPFSFAAGLHPAAVLQSRLQQQQQEPTCKSKSHIRYGVTFHSGCVSSVLRTLYFHYFRCFGHSGLSETHHFLNSLKSVHTHTHTHIR